MPLVSLASAAGAGVPPPVVFLPTKIAGLNRWYDAQDAGSLTKSGSSISAWGDRSGNGYGLSQANAGEQPNDTRTINGFQAIDFDGANDDLGGTTGVAGLLDGTDSALTFAMALKADSFPGSGNEQVISLTSDSDVHPFYAFSMRNSDAFRVGGADDSQSLGVVSVEVSPADPTDPHVWIVVKQATTVDFYVDGAQLVAGAAWDLGGSVSVTRFNLGAFVAGASDTQHFDGLIGEVCVYERALALGELKDLNAYLLDHWAIAAAGGSPQL